MTHVDNNTESRKSKHLTYGEMQKIEAYKALDLSNRKIAALLGRSPQTINNAINTASVMQKSQQKQNGKTYTYYKTVYSANIHYDIYLQNRSNNGRRHKWVESDRVTEWADRKMLEDKWSPNTVIHEAKDLFDLALVPIISTLYNWIDSGIMRTKNIDLLEKVGGKPRSTKGRTRRNIKFFGTTIEERPKSIENWQELGH